MDKIMLDDPGIEPDTETLGRILGKTYLIYESVIDSVTGPDYGLETLWRWYNDGKSWLCKAVFRKKTIFWLSVWDGYFKVSFYFLERHCREICELDIDPGIKEALSGAKPSGALYPVTLEMRKPEQIRDLLRLVEYKKKIK